MTVAPPAEKLLSLLWAVLQQVLTEAQEVHMQCNCGFFSWEVICFLHIQHVRVPTVRATLRHPFHTSFSIDLCPQSARSPATWSYLNSSPTMMFPMTGTL